LSNKAIDQQLLEDLIIGALNKERAVRPADVAPDLESSTATLTKPRILLVDGSESSASLTQASLQGTYAEVVTVKSDAEAAQALRGEVFEVVITQLRMENVDAFDVIRQASAVDPDTVVTVIAGTAHLESALRALEEGATDFVIQPFAPQVLRAKAHKALALAKSRRQLALARGRLQALESRFLPSASALVAHSEAMQRLSALCYRAAEAGSTVLIQGEPGTGKELVARRIHSLSSRKDAPFVSVQCGGLPPTLLDAELFGHEGDATTGARPQPGRFELAQGGTLYLDGVAELPLPLQAKVLRTIQERELTRVGSDRKRRVSVRLICATHRDLKLEVDKGRFRQDLYYRLHVVPLLVPALRERAEDIPALARQFAEDLAIRLGRPLPSLTPDVLRALGQHPWPGNVRELKNVIEHALMTAREWVDMGDLPAMVRTRTGQESGASLLRKDRPLPDILGELEHQLIEEAYTKANKVKTETARLLGIKTSALYYKLEKYGFIQKGEAAASEDSSPG
jgi:two-component system, NtrC family, response regulator HydG